MRLIALAALAALLAACGARPDSAWQPGRAEAVAWWLEDIAHGVPRLPGEIDPVGGGPGDAAIARWAAGSDIAGRWQPPRQLQLRRARWPALRQGLADGEVVAARDGLLAPAPGVEPARRAQVTSLVDAENDDRRLIDGLVLGLGSPDPAVESAYHQAIRSARRMHEAPPAAQVAPAGPAAR